MFDDPDKEFEEIAPRFMRGDTVPSLQIGVVFALFCLTVIFQDPVSCLPKLSAVLFLRFPDGGLIPG